MKIPMPPPATEPVLRRLLSQPERLMAALYSSRRDVSQRYLPWDELRYRSPPDGLTIDEYWAAVKLGRRQLQRPLPLLDRNSKPFSFALPDDVLEHVEAVNRDLSGRIAMSEQVTNPATRDRFLVSSLMEEAITSSQLEGAMTSRHVAKEMIRTGRPPRTRDERMILNNYHAMLRIREVADQDLTPDQIFEIHRVVTDGTLDNADSAGRLQRPDEVRVAVYDDKGHVLHTPPPAFELPERMTRLCAFANGATEGGYVPPVLRAITVHFMLGYDHPFEDGNGRTARALFYWCMLRYGYWLTEFLAISRILRAAPGKYARSFLHTEQDDNDLTYFHAYQLKVLRRAVSELHQYLARKAAELHDLQRLLAAGQVFNHRQAALLSHAVRNPGAHYTTESHSRSHRTSIETARQDLRGLETVGLLVKRRRGKGFTWTPVPDLVERLQSSSPRP